MKQKLYYGFNFQWMYSFEWGIREADTRALDFMQAVGLNFVRIPMDYRFWTTGIDYFNPDYAIMENAYTYFTACEKRNIHYCLNLHRAPGYCINNNELEKENLWVDKNAQDGFVFIWEVFARRFKGIPGALVSFDLMNEPPGIGEYGLTRKNHKALVKRTVEAIWSIDPERPVIVDGLAGGHLTIPELCDLPLMQSTRGYQPFALTHFKAEWCKATAKVKNSIYPGTKWEHKRWDKRTLAKFYTPWRSLQEKGVAVHVGEFGCFNTVENAFALAWFADLLSLFKAWNWGYALWMFEGAFGIVKHGRPGTVYTDYNGYMVDKELLDLYLSNRVME